MTKWKPFHAKQRQKTRKIKKAAVGAMSYSNLAGMLAGDMPDERKRRLLAGALDRGEITEQQHASLVRMCCA